MVGTNRSRAQKAVRKDRPLIRALARGGCFTAAAEPPGPPWDVVTSEGLPGIAWLQTMYFPARLSHPGDNEGGGFRCFTAASDAFREALGVMDDTPVGVRSLGAKPASARPSRGPCSRCPAAVGPVGRVRGMHRIGMNAKTGFDRQPAVLCRVASTTIRMV